MSCRDCRFWKWWPEHGVGYCTITPGDEDEGCWAITGPDEGCGWFEEYVFEEEEDQ